MPTPRPTRAIRYSAMKLTLVISVTMRSSRNVVRIEMPAMASGSTASRLAKTNASTTSAPSAPIMASAITPLPCLAGLAFSSWRSPVIAHGPPRRGGGLDRPRDRDVCGLKGVGLVAWREDQRVRAAPAGGDERAVAGGRVVGDPHVRHGVPGREYAAGLGGHTTAVDRLARWQRDDRHRWVSRRPRCHTGLRSAGWWRIRGIRPVRNSWSARQWWSWR